MTKKQIEKLNKERRAAFAAIGFEYAAENTKKAETIRASYRRNLGTIYQAYGRPSYRKIDIWESWARTCRDLNGYGLHVTAAGCQTFSIGFKFPCPVTGEIMTAWITKGANRVTADID